MIERLRGDSEFRGDAYQQLLMGQDTDEAQAAAQHLGDAIDIFIQLNTKK